MPEPQTPRFRFDDRPEWCSLVREVAYRILTSRRGRSTLARARRARRSRGRRAPSRPGGRRSDGGPVASSLPRGAFRPSGLSPSCGFPTARAPASGCGCSRSSAEILDSLADRRRDGGRRYGVSSQWGKTLLLDALSRVGHRRGSVVAALCDAVSDQGAGGARQFSRERVTPFIHHESDHPRSE